MIGLCGGGVFMEDFGIKRILPRLLVVFGVVFLSGTILAGTQDSINGFKQAIQNNDTREFKNLTHPGGLILARSFNNPGRGLDLLVRTTEIPANFQFPAPNGMAFDLKYLFGGTLRSRDLSGLETRIPGLVFNEGSISAIRHFAQKILAFVHQKKRGYTPTMIVTDNYLVLTEADINNEMLSGSIAVFLRLGNDFLLRAIIDLR
jgi:hypothetical protein